VSEVIAIIDRQLAQTRDRLDRAAAQIETVNAEFQRHCYEWHVNQNKQSQAQIQQLRQERERLVAEQEGLTNALAGLEQKKAAARDAVARDVNKEHARAALAVLAELEALGPKLSELVRHPRPEDHYGAEFYCENNPPLCCLAAKLTAELVNEHLRALGLNRGASFPPNWHGAASKMDLERALLKMIAVGWPSAALELAPRERTSARPGQVGRNPDFTPEF
jgi:hypothetical protein